MFLRGTEWGARSPGRTPGTQLRGPRLCTALPSRRQVIAPGQASVSSSVRWGRQPQPQGLLWEAPEELLLQTQSASCNTGTWQTTNNRPLEPSLRLQQLYTLTSDTLHLETHRAFFLLQAEPQAPEAKIPIPPLLGRRGDFGGDFRLYEGHQMTHAKETEPVKKKCLGPSLHSTPPTTRLKEGSVLEDWNDNLKTVHHSAIYMAKKKKKPKTKQTQCNLRSCNRK